MWKRAGLFCVLIISMALIVSCDEENCPVCPVPEEIVSDYDVYLAGVSGNPLYIYNTKEMAITDSFDIVTPGWINGMEVSAEGRHLFLSGDMGNGYIFRVYDLATRDTIPVDRSVGDRMEVSTDGKYIALFGRSRTYFLDGADYSILSAPYIQTDDGCFSADGTKFYCITNFHDIRVYDMVSQTLDTVFQYFDNNGVSPNIYHIQCAYNQPKIYMAVTYPPGFPTFDSLVAYSLEEDSTTLGYSIGPAAGYLGITPDGNQIIYTDCGHVMLGLYGSMHVIFIDPQTDAVISLVDAGHSGQGNIPTGFPPGMFAVTPDSRYTVVASAAGAWAFGMIDNVQHRFVDVNIYEPQTISFGMAACRKLPK